MDIMSDDLKSAKSALAKLHHDMEAINKLAKPSYLSVIEQMERTLEPIRRQHLEISRALEMSGAMARIQEIVSANQHWQDLIKQGTATIRIAKSLSVMGMDGPMVLVVMGTARLDNRKFKDVFGCKPRFIKPEDLPDMVGHPMGGVCPFALRDTVRVYLDASLRNFDPIYPAAGAPNNMVRITLDELERITGGTWVDVCKEEQPA